MTLGHLTIGLPNLVYLLDAENRKASKEVLLITNKGKLNPLEKSKSSCMFEKKKKKINSFSVP